MDENINPKPLYAAASGVSPEDVAVTLNAFYGSGYHLKELIPELAGPKPMNYPDGISHLQTYTVLVVLA